MSDPQLDEGRRKTDLLRRRRLDLDVRGILAILALIGAFTLAFVQLLYSATGPHTADIPAWAATTVGAIVGFYFGGRGSGGGGNGH